MDYQNTLLYLYNSVPMFQQVGSSAYKEGLENTQALDEHFGHPHRNFHSIHVGGQTEKDHVHTRLPQSYRKRDTEWDYILLRISWIFANVSV